MWRRGLSHSPRQDARRAIRWKQGGRWWHSSEALRRLLKSSWPDLIRPSIFFERMGTRVPATQVLRRAFSHVVGEASWRSRQARERRTSALLLRLPLLHGPPGIAPGGETAAHMGDRLQAHVLRSLGREHRAQATGAMEDEFPVLLEDRLGVGARRIDPELQHAARAGEGAGDPALALDLPGIADVHDDDVPVRRELDGVSRADGLDLGIGLVDQRLDAAVNGLGHGPLPWFYWRAVEARVTCEAYRTSCFIAFSRPSIVIGYMRCEKMRRMMVVDSE